MLAEHVVRNCRQKISETAVVPNGDHRKRRRNRTTQSCLNCHTSKRMCDRKRPACARCTQLGLTGLCVYEVDDPTQRSETQDESSRLIKRVAELEGVIRELKNKPHPRWVEGSNSGEKWHARLHPVADGEHEICLSNAPSPPEPSSPSGKGRSHPSLTCVPNYPKSEAEGFPATINLQAFTDCSQQNSPYYQGSDLSTPSPPSLLTPTDEYPPSLPHVDIAGIASLKLSQDYDLASMFLTYPGVMGCADNSLGSGILDKEHGSHCGCLREPSNYHIMLELSLRLRKASDILSRSPTHRNFHFCPLRQTISSLDNFMTNALSDITTTVGNLSDSLMSTYQLHQVPTPDEILSSQTSCPKRPINNIQNYHLSPNVNSLSSLDDSFMSWEPPPSRHY